MVHMPSHIWMLYSTWSGYKTCTMRQHTAPTPPLCHFLKVDHLCNLSKWLLFSFIIIFINNTMHVIHFMHVPFVYQYTLYTFEKRSLILKLSVWVPIYKSRITTSKGLKVCSNYEGKAHWKYNGALLKKLRGITKESGAIILERLPHKWLNTRGLT